MWIQYRMGGKYKWELMETVHYFVGIEVDYKSDYLDMLDGTLTVRKGYCWDGASGPAIDTANFMGASLIHDALYQLMREEIISRKCRKIADKILKQICLECGMSKPRAWWVYIAVRIGARKSAKRRSE